MPQKICLVSSKICLVLALGTNALACTEAPTRGPTWYGDVRPIVKRACTACHDGQGVGGVNLNDAATAQAWAGVMATKVSSGQMPPPALDATCRSYAGAERMSLRDDEKALLSAWADAGAPLGDPAQTKPVEESMTHIEAPDLVLEMPEAHAVTPENDGNEYWCTIVDNPLATTAWVEALEAIPGEPNVVHHIALYRDLGHDAGAGYGAPSGTTAFPCRNPILELDWQLLHSFAPGVGMAELPKGTGIRIEPGDQIVMQMHYYSPTPGTLDRSKYWARLAKQAPATEVYMDVFGPVPFTLPAGAQNHVETATITNDKAPMTIYGILPHMHLLGRSYNAWIEDDAGAKTCVGRGNFDFHHQALYLYDEPIVWNPGQTLVTSCTWDNSATSKGQPNVPPLDIEWGEGTHQEMCFMVAYVSTP